MSYVVSEVYEVFIAVVTVVLLASLFTGAVEGQGRAQQPSAQASSESPGTTDRQIKARLAAKGQRTPAQRKVPSWKAHQLVGDRKGVWSLSVTKNWRITFRIDQATIEIVDLDYEDYH